MLLLKWPWMAKAHMKKMVLKLICRYPSTGWVGWVHQPLECPRRPYGARFCPSTLLDVMLSSGMRSYSIPRALRVHCSSGDCTTTNGDKRDESLVFMWRSFTSKTTWNWCCINWNFDYNIMRQMATEPSFKSLWLSRPVFNWSFPPKHTNTQPLLKDDCISGSYLVSVVVCLLK